MALNCPRCKLPLKPESYEGVPVDACSECWGYWLDRGEFARIADSRRFDFSEEERRRLLEAAAGAKKEKEPPLPCPRCEKTMEKVEIAAEARVTLDRCPSHGVWFDTKELKLAQVMAETASSVRKLFFTKLREP